MKGIMEGNRRERGVVPALVFLIVSVGGFSWALPIMAPRIRNRAASIGLKAPNHDQLSGVQIQLLNMPHLRGGPEKAVSPPGSVKMLVRNLLVKLPAPYA